MTDRVSLINSLSCVYRVHIAFSLINFACAAAATAILMRLTIPVFVISVVDLAGICIISDTLTKINPYGSIQSVPGSLEKSLLNARGIYIFIGVAWMAMFLCNATTASILIGFQCSGSYGYSSCYWDQWAIPLLLAGLSEFALMITAFRMSVLAGKVRASILGLNVGDCCGPPVCDSQCSCGECCCGNQTKNDKSCCGYIVISSSPNQIPSFGSITVPNSGTMSSIVISSSPQSDDLTTRLTKFYAKYDPSKLREIPDFVSYINKEGLEAFNILLRKKYMTDLSTFESV